MNRPLRLVALGLLSACVFLAFLGRRPISTHEARVAQTAREMSAVGWPWQSGTVSVPRVQLSTADGLVRLQPQWDQPPIAVNPWVVPTINAQVRLQKPPLPYWCTAVAYLALGRSEWTARLTPAIFGIAGTFLTFALTRRLRPRLAWVAAMIWISSYFVISEYAKAMADPYLAFFVLACACAWISASDEQRRQRPGRTSIGWLLLFYLCIGLGLLAKGPVMLAHVAIAVGAYHFCYRRRPWPGRVGIHLAGVAIALLISCWWPILVARQLPHAWELWRYESIGELQDNTENARPWWFYLPACFEITLPWTPVWLIGMAAALLRRRRGRRTLFPILWFALTLVFFSFVNLKKNAYLLPVMPAIVLTTAHAGRAIVRWAARRHRAAGWPNVLQIAQSAMGAGLAIFLCIELRTLGSAPLFVTACVLAIVAGAWPILRLRTPCKSRWFAAQAIAYAVLLVLFFRIYHAQRDLDRSPQRFAQRVAERLVPIGGTLVRDGLSETLLFYLPDAVQVDQASPRAFAALRWRSDEQPELPKTLPYQGKIMRATQWQAVWTDPPPDSAGWQLFELSLESNRAQSGDDEHSG